MKVSRFAVGSVKAVLVVALFLAATLSWAHPDDEFCDRAIMDVALCSQLAELDRPATAETGSWRLPQVKLDRPLSETVVLYIALGFEHIIPKGLDHLAFVLALVLSAFSLKLLLFHISVFTLAHSFTLALGVLGMVDLNAFWVELAIALSIVFVALENLLVRLNSYWRSAVVFIFGLLHGLGFAGVLAELGIPESHFFGALLGFNIGVELGQISFAMVFFFLLLKLMKSAQLKRSAALIGNGCIALFGMYLLFDRVF